MVKGKLPDVHWSGKDFALLREEACLYRPCLHLDVNKGSYTKGRGYTHYYDDPDVVCMHNHLHGCPHPIPEPVAEKMRCCPAPTFAKSRSNPRRQRCKTCGAWLNGLRLELVKTLEHHPHSKCSHAKVREREWALDKAWWCPDCDLWWDAKPSQCQVGETLEVWRDRKNAEFDAKLSKKRKEIGDGTGI